MIGDDRRSIEKRVGDTERHVHRAGPERRHAHAGPPLDLAAHVRHERRRGFVPRQQELDAFALGGVDEVENLAARQAEHARDAGVAQRASQSLCTGLLCQFTASNEKRNTDYADFVD